MSEYWGKVEWLNAKECLKKFKNIERRGPNAFSIHTNNLIESCSIVAHLRQTVSLVSLVTGLVHNQRRVFQTRYFVLLYWWNQCFWFVFTIYLFSPSSVKTWCAFPTLAQRFQLCTLCPLRHLQWLHFAPRQPSPALGVVLCPPAGWPWSQTCPWHLLQPSNST